METNEVHEYPQFFDTKVEPGSQEAPSFEEAYARLAETVHALETGGLTLEEATGLYEEGMRLVQVCNQLLSKAELRVTQLRDIHFQRPGPDPKPDPDEDAPDGDGPDDHGYAEL